MSQTLSFDVEAVISNIVLLLHCVNPFYFCLFFSTLHFEDLVLALVEAVDFLAFLYGTHMTFLGIPLAVAVFVTILELHVYHFIVSCLYSKDRKIQMYCKCLV